MKSTLKYKFLTLSILIIFIGGFSTVGLAEIIPPGGGGGNYAYKYKTILGLKSGGSISDTYTINDIHLRWTCAWLYFGGFNFGGEINLYFAQVYAKQLQLRFAAGRGWMDDGSSRVSVKYTDGTKVILANDPDDGYHTFPLNQNKRINYVIIEYGEFGTGIPGDRYIWVDYIKIII